MATAYDTSEENVGISRDVLGVMSLGSTFDRFRLSCPWFDATAVVPVMVVLVDKW
jgi:hypothetical protein